MPLYQQADKAILLWLLGAKNLGLYVAALSASTAVGSITRSAGIVSFTAAAQVERGEGFEKIAKTFRLSALLWLFFGGILAIAMPILLPLVYGGEFAPSVNPARLLIIGTAFAGLANLLDQNMRGQGRAFVGLEGRILGLVVILIVGLISTQWLGLIGMCLAFIFGQLTCLSFFLWRVLAHYGRGFRGIESFCIKRNDLEYLLSRFRDVLKKSFLS
jgi:O-antigen/teichoic acid export membrane protein